MSGSIKLFTRNILETGTVTVTGTPDTGFPESRLYDRGIDLFWKDTVTEAKVFHVDQGAVDQYEVDGLFIARHNFNGEDLEWQYSSDDFSADENDAVAGWTQPDNALIAKEAAAAIDSRYWRINLTSMANPKCSEIFLSYGYQFDILAKPGPANSSIDNVMWMKTVGGMDRSVLAGRDRRVRGYSMSLAAADLANFRAAMDDLQYYSKPFYLKDHEGNFIFMKVSSPPKELWSNPTNTAVSIEMTEVL